MGNFNVNVMRDIFKNTLTMDKELPNPSILIKRELCVHPVLLTHTNPRLGMQTARIDRKTAIIGMTVMDQILIVNTIELRLSLMMAQITGVLRIHLIIAV